MDAIKLEDLLTIEDQGKLEGRPMREKLLALLAGEVGPLAGDGAGFTGDQALAGYICWRAFLRRDQATMLAHRPSYEAWELVQTRLQLATRRARQLRGLPGELMRGLGLDARRVLTREEMVWWRITAADADGRRVAGLRSAEARSECMTAAQMCSSWFWELRGMFEDECEI